MQHLPPSASLSSTARLGATCLALAALAIAGCDPRVPTIPPAARAQMPRSTPNSPWQAKGRLELVAPGKRISCTAIVRNLGNGTVGAVFLSDEGLLLADLSASGGEYTVKRAIPDLNDALPHLGRLVAQAFAAAPVEARAWRGDCLVATIGKETRWYGGDPVLLRAITGGGLDIYIEDYRQLAGELLAHEVRAEGPFGITLRLHLDDAKANAASPPAEPR